MMSILADGVLVAGVVARL
ncbi:hypothetical protein JD422_09395 [Leclercia adecarboxylata]|nr:hypothetical protein [Leclercia adecarboxylata]